MTTTFTHLRMHRKQTPLILSDVSTLLGYKDNTLLSKAEKGHRPPSIDMILGYHLLFHTPMLSYFDTLRNNLKSNMLKRIPQLIESLKYSNLSENAAERAVCLQTALTRLSNEPTYDQGN
ncbi:MAG: hypothetical protein POELPBGB_02942 [Bacteroidia bacterium]|nr:hypothetical protein [Bacteroidia bacterium]